MFQLQNRAESGIWGNWVSKKSIQAQYNKIITPYFNIQQNALQASTMKIKVFADTICGWC